jgi:hypothetical protein
VYISFADLLEKQHLQVVVPETGTRVVKNNNNIDLSKVKNETVTKEPNGPFTAILDDLEKYQKKFAPERDFSRSQPKLTPEIKGMVTEEDRGLAIDREKGRTRYEKIYQIILGMQALQNHAEKIAVLDNGKKFSENTGAQLLHAATGFASHSESTALKAIVKDTPALFLNAYQKAKEQGKVEEFFENAFEMSNPCFEAMHQKISVYIESQMREELVGESKMKEMMISINPQHWENPSKNSGQILSKFALAFRERAMQLYAQSINKSYEEVLKLSKNAREWQKIETSSDWEKHYNGQAFKTYVRGHKEFPAVSSKRPDGITDGQIDNFIEYSF